MRTGTRIGKLEAQFNVQPDDPFEGVGGRDLAKLLSGQKDIDQAPRRVENAVLWLALIDLSNVLRKGDRPGADADELAEAARMRQSWQLPSEGPVDIVQVGKREGLPDPLLKKLRWQLEHPPFQPEWSTDPDAPQGVANHPGPDGCANEPENGPGLPA
jgi:hypothetical protein